MYMSTCMLQHFTGHYDFTYSVVCGTIIFDMGMITKKARISRTDQYGGSLDVSIEASNSYVNLRVNDCIRTIVTNLRSSGGS